MLKRIDEQRQFIEQNTTNCPEVITKIDRVYFKKHLLKSLEEDESMFYKEEDVARTERYNIIVSMETILYFSIYLIIRAANFASVIKAYSKKANLFCNNGDFENAKMILEILTEHGNGNYGNKPLLRIFLGMPVFQDIDDAFNELSQSFEELVSVWKYLLSNSKIEGKRIFIGNFFVYN